MTRIPTELRRLDSTGLKIIWSDGEQKTLSSKLLRENCPCATCKELRGDTSHSTPIQVGKGRAMLKVIEHTVDESLRLDQIWAVGRYAVGLKFGDGHDTGIYTFDYLSELVEKQ